MYKVYEYRTYRLQVIARDVTEEGLNKYGKLDRKIYDNYPDKNPNEVGMVLTDGKRSFYAFLEKRNK